MNAAAAGLHTRHAAAAEDRSDAGPDLEPTVRPQASRPRSSRRELSLAFGAIALVALFLVLANVSRATQFSVYDEATHLDYAWKISHGHIPAGQELLAKWTRDTWSCHGQYTYPGAVPPCGAHVVAEKYPAFGYNYNYVHPPLYYAVTGVAARVGAAISGKEFFTLARSFGAVWLIATMFGMFLTLRYWRLPFGYALTGALGLATYEMVVYLDSVVSNDAVAALCGVGALYVLGRWLIYDKRGWPVPVILAALATLTKSINAVAFVAIGVIGLGLAVAAWRRSNRRDAFRWIRVSLLTLLSVATVHLVWSAIQLSRTPANYHNPAAGQNTQVLSGFALNDWAPTLFSGFTLGSGMYLDPTVDSPYLAAWTALLTVLTAAASVLCIMTFRRGTPEFIAGVTLLVGCPLYPLAVQSIAAREHIFFPLVTSRYGLALIPFAVLCLVLVAHAKKLERFSRGFVAGGLAIAAFTSVGIL